MPPKKRSGSSKGSSAKGAKKRSKFSHTAKRKYKKPLSAAERKSERKEFGSALKDNLLSDTLSQNRWFFQELAADRYAVGRLVYRPANVLDIYRRLTKWVMDHEVGPVLDRPDYISSAAFGVIAARLPLTKKCTSVGEIKRVLALDLRHQLSQVCYSYNNRFRLMARDPSQSNLYATMKQVNKEDGKIAKGSKSLPLSFWKPQAEGKDGRADGKGEADDEHKMTHVHSRIFALPCLTGDKFDQIRRHLENVWKALCDGFEPVVQAEHTLMHSLDRYGVKLSHDSTGSAYYTVSDHTIHTGLPSAYGQSEEYYHTFFHQLGHYLLESDSSYRTWEKIKGKEKNARKKDEEEKKERKETEEKEDEKEEKEDEKEPEKKEEKLDRKVRGYCMRTQLTEEEIVAELFACMVGRELGMATLAKSTDFCSHLLRALTRGAKKRRMATEKWIDDLVKAASKMVDAFFKDYHIDAPILDGALSTRLPLDLVYLIQAYHHC